MKEVEEEMPTGFRKALPAEVPPTVRVGDASVQVEVPPERKQPPVVKHVPGLQDFVHGEKRRRLECWVGRNTRQAW